jgi:predicted amidohydrolase
MQDLTIAAAQFEHHSGDKAANLSVIGDLVRKAKERGADVVSFHELSVPGYTFLRRLSRDEAFDIAEQVPDGESTGKLIMLAGRYDLTILAGILERAGDRLFNTYVCINKDGLVAKSRKLHPFIHPDLSPGEEYVTFDIGGWTCGILI